MASFPAGSRADQVLFDKAHHRVYVLSGEGSIYPYDTSRPGNIAPLPQVPSAPGAKTGVLSGDGTPLYVSVSPGEGKTGARVLTFTVN